MYRGAHWASTHHTVRRQLGVRAAPLGAERGRHVQGAALEPEGPGAVPARGHGRGPEPLLGQRPTEYIFKEN